MDVRSVSCDVHDLLSLDDGQFCVARHDAIVVVGRVPGDHFNIFATADRGRDTTLLT